MNRKEIYADSIPEIEIYNHSIPDFTKHGISEFKNLRK